MSEAPAFSPDGTRVAFLYVEGATRPGRGAGRHEAARRRHRRGRSRDSAGGRGRCRTRPSRSLRRWPRPPICTSTSSTGRRTRSPWPTWPPIRREKTTGGWPSSTRRRLQVGRSAHTRILAPAEVRRPAARLADCRAALVAGRQGDRLHRRPDERPGSDGRRCVDRLRRRRRARNLTQERPTSPAWIEWDSNEHLYVSELAGGNCHLILLRPARATGPATADSINFGAAHLQHSRHRGRRADGDEPFFRRGDCTRCSSSAPAPSTIRRKSMRPRRDGDEASWTEGCDPAFALQRRRGTGLGQIRLA